MLPQVIVESGTVADPGHESRLRRCSHCSAKLVTSVARPWIGQHPSRLSGQHPRPAELAPFRRDRESVSSGMLLQRKKDIRDASSIIAMGYAVFGAAPAIALDTEQKVR